MVILLKLLLKFLGRRSLLFIFIFRLYIFEFINPNLNRFDLTDCLCILGMFNDVNNTSKKGPIGKVTVSIKIEQFHDLVYNPIIRLNVLIWTESINRR